MTDPDTPDLDPTNLQLAAFFARQHKVPGFVFWRAEDWREIHAVECRRVDPEHVQIQTRTVGRGFLV